MTNGNCVYIQGVLLDVFICIHCEMTSTIKLVIIFITSVFCFVLFCILVYGEDT